MAEQRGSRLADQRADGAGVGLALISFALFTDLLLYGLLVPVLPLRAAELGVSAWQVGLLFGCYPLGMLPAAALAGTLADRYGRRLPLLGAVAALAVATLLFALAPGYGWLVGARLAQGVAAGVVATAGFALVADLYPAARRGWATGIVSVGMSAGYMVGPPLGGLLADLGGFRLPFLLMAALILAELVAFLVLLPKVRGAPGEAVSVRGLLRDRGVRGLLVAAALSAGVWGLIEPMLPLRLERDFGASAGTIGLVFGAATVVYTLTMPAVGASSDRVGRRAIIAAGLLLMAVLLPALALFDSLLLIGAALTVVGVGYGFAQTPVVPALTEIVDRHGGGSYGSASAAYNVAYGAGMTVGPVVGGALVEVAGLAATLGVSAALLIAALPAFLLLSRPGNVIASGPPVATPVTPPA